MYSFVILSLALKNVINKMKKEKQTTLQWKKNKIILIKRRKWTVGGEFLMNISVFAYLFELCGWKERQQNLRNTSWKEKREQKLFLPLLPTSPSTLEKKREKKKRRYFERSDKAENISVRWEMSKDKTVLQMGRDIKKYFTQTLTGHICVWS